MGKPWNCLEAYESVKQNYKCRHKKRPNGLCIRSHWECAAKYEILMWVIGLWEYDNMVKGGYFSLSWYFAAGDDIADHPDFLMFVLLSTRFPRQSPNGGVAQTVANTNDEILKLAA